MEAPWRQRICPLGCHPFQCLGWCLMHISTSAVTDCVGVDPTQRFTARSLCVLCLGGGRRQEACLFGSLQWPQCLVRTWQELRAHGESDWMQRGGRRTPRLLCKPRATSSARCSLSAQSCLSARDSLRPHFRSGFVAQSWSPLSPYLMRLSYFICTWVSMSAFCEEL